MLPVALVKLQGLAGLSRWPVSLLLSFQIEVQFEPEVVGLLSCELCPHDGPPDIDTQKIFSHQVTKILFLWPFHGFRLPKNAAQQPQLKTDCLFYSIYKLDTIDIADPSSMLEACHMNFVIDLTHHRVSVAQW